MNLIEEAITAHWGARCHHYEQGCFVCEAWKQYDEGKALTRRYDDAMERIHNLTAELEYLRREVHR